jgi:hypothetical protein
VAGAPPVDLASYSSAPFELGLAGIALNLNIAFELYKLDPKLITREAEHTVRKP